MASIQRTLTGKCARPSEQRLSLLNSATWEEEIEEVLRSAREPLRNRVADPDWLAACHFLVCHCREALSGQLAHRRVTAWRCKLSSSRERRGAASVRPPNRRAL